MRLLFKNQTSEIYFPGNISKNCTSDGWSETFPDFIDACGYSDPEDESKVGARPAVRLLSLTLHTTAFSTGLLSVVVQLLHPHLAPELLWPLEFVDSA